jgi:hypothetical protein
METLICLIIAGFVANEMVKAAYRTGKRDGSRAAYGVGFARGRRSRQSTGCVVPLFIMVATLTTAVALAAR